MLPCVFVLATVPSSLPRPIFIVESSTSSVTWSPQFTPLIAYAEPLATISMAASKPSHDSVSELLPLPCSSASIGEAKLRSSSRIYIEIVGLGVQGRLGTHCVMSFASQKLSLYGFLLPHTNCAWVDFLLTEPF